MISEFGMKESKTMDFDDAYANGAYITDSAAFPSRWAKIASQYRAETMCNLDIPYGRSARQQLDVFHPSGASKGTVVFVHGGYWVDFDKSSWSHLARGANASGWTVAVPSYDLCPDVSIAQITSQIGAALTQVALMTSGSIRLVGHSAGGHLVARMLDPAFQGEWHSRIDHVMPISPLSDLEPLLQTKMNEQLGLSMSDAKAESPINQPAPTCPVTVWVGVDERPAFLDQAEWLSKVWDCPLHIAPNKHHFDVIDDLVDPESELMRTLLG